MIEPDNHTALTTPYGVTYVRYNDDWYPIPPNGHAGGAWDWVMVSRLGPFTNADPETTARAIERVRLDLATASSRASLDHMLESAERNGVRITEWREVDAAGEADQ